MTISQNILPDIHGSLFAYLRLMHLLLFICGLRVFENTNEKHLTFMMLDIVGKFGQTWNKV